MYKHETSHQGHVIFSIALFLIGSAFGYGMGMHFERANDVENKTAETTSVSTTTAKPTVSNSSPTTTTPATTSPKTMTPVVIYTEEVKSVDSNNRSWPTVKIMRKIGDSNPEELAQVGKVGEFPDGFVLSPDKNTLLIELESKLQQLDLKTKSLTDLFTPNHSLGYGRSVVFSPDGTRLFIWDQLYASTTDKSYSVHNFSIADKKDIIIKSGTLDSFYSAITWRDDNTVALMEPFGEGANAWYYDLKTNEIKQTNGKPNTGTYSDSGKLMTLDSKSVEDACNEMSGSAVSIYNIIDPVTGTKIGEFGDPAKAVSPIGFSTDDKQIVYSTRALAKNVNDCDKLDSAALYYKIGVDGRGTPTVLTTEDLGAFREKIGKPLYASTSTTDNKHHTITYAGKSIIESSNELSVKVSFFQ